jgi:hypothetical protein
MKGEGERGLKVKELNNPPRILCGAGTLEKMSGQTTQLRGINTQYESIG